MSKSVSVPGPGLITRRMCVAAMDMVYGLVIQAMGSGLFNKKHGCLIVFNPAVRWEPKYQGGPSNPLFVADVPYFLYPFGDPRKWETPYTLVAMSKGYGSFVTGCDSRLIPPALFSPGMSTFPGAIIGRCGMPIMFSGVQSHFDETIALIFDAILYGLAMEKLDQLNKAVDPIRRSLPPIDDDLTMAQVADELDFDLELLLLSVTEQLTSADT